MIPTSVAVGMPVLPPGVGVGLFVLPLFTSPVDAAVGRLRVFAVVVAFVAAVVVASVDAGAEVSYPFPAQYPRYILPALAAAMEGLPTEQL